MNKPGDLRLDKKSGEAIILLSRDTDLHFTQDAIYCNRALLPEQYQSSGWILV